MIRKVILQVLPKYGVKKASLFGSFARGDVSSSSDIDLLVEFEGKRSLLDLAGLKLELEERLRKDVDVVTYKSLNPLLREQILTEQVVIL